MNAKALRRPHTIAGLVAAGLGLVVVGAAFAHSIAVTGVAFAAGRGYDTRLATLLIVGIAALVPGLLLLVHGWRLHRRVPSSGAHVVGAAFTMVLICLVLAPIDPGFRQGVVITAAVLATLLGLLAWERTTAAIARLDRHTSPVAAQPTKHRLPDHG